MYNRKMNLLEETLKMLRETSISNQVIADKANVSVRWLYVFAEQGYRDYGIIRVQRVHDVLVEILGKD